MGRIRLLADEVASQVAAGEVVERPASVVKELVENSIDAGARKIEVEIQRGGIALMRVRDDGCGMSPDDAARSLERHATSKLRSSDDLNGILIKFLRLIELDAPSYSTPSINDTCSTETDFCIIDQKRRQKRKIKTSQTGRIDRDPIPVDFGSFRSGSTKIDRRNSSIAVVFEINRHGILKSMFQSIF